MAKSNVFRFAIADSKPRSECWSIIVNKSDVYMIGSAHRNRLKTSLHGSGVCQVALLEEFFEEHISDLEQGPENRSILRWKRLPAPKGRGQVAATILFASYEYWPEAEAIPASKTYTALHPPPDMYATMVDVVFSLDDPVQAAALGGWSSELLFSTQLLNGEFVCVTHHLERLPTDFFDMAPLPSTYVLSLGGPEEDPNDARGISWFDCAQLFEGHGCIRSLHNMRLTWLAQTEQ